MIPKIIHYCWLGSEIPEFLQKNIDGWREIMPDYEFIKWDFDRFPKGKSVWVDQACEMRKYAFASDYIRLYALYNYGGIYLDTDVKILKPLDVFLDLPYFVGMENNDYGIIGTGTLGFPKGHQLLKQLLDRYEDRPFINKYGKLEMEPNTVMFRRYVDAQMELHVISDKKDFIDAYNVFNAFAPDFFCPKNSESQEISVTENTYAIHDFAASWVESQSKMPGTEISLRHAFIKRLLIRRSIVVVSNSMYERHFNDKFGLSSRGPLWDAYVSEEDFELLMGNKDSIFNNTLVFIDCKKSKYFNKNEFYPIAIIEGTNIELHFKRCYSKEQARNSWNNGIQNIANKRVIYVCRTKYPSRITDCLTCLMINIGRTIIRF